MLSWFKKKKRTKSSDEVENAEDQTTHIPVTQKQATRKRKDKVVANVEVCSDLRLSMSSSLLLPLRMKYNY